MDRKSFLNSIPSMIAGLLAAFSAGGIGAVLGHTRGPTSHSVSEIPLFGNTPHGGRVVVSRDGKRVSPVAVTDNDGKGCICQQIKQLKNDGDLLILDGSKAYPGKAHPGYPYYQVHKDDRAGVLEALGGGDDCVYPAHCSNLYVFCEGKVWNIDVVVDTYSITNYQCFCIEHDRQICG